MREGGFLFGDLIAHFDNHKTNEVLVVAIAEDTIRVI